MTPCPVDIPDLQGFLEVTDEAGYAAVKAGQNTPWPCLLPSLFDHPPEQPPVAALQVGNQREGGVDGGLSGGGGVDAGDHGIEEGVGEGLAQSAFTGVHAAIGYSAGQVLEAAVRLAGSTEHDAVRDQLGSMFFRSLLGKYRVDETGRQIGHKNFMLQWQDSERRLVAPVNVAERKLIYPFP